MESKSPKPLTWIDHAVGWWLLVMGIALLGTGALMPLWLERRDLTAQRDLIVAQAKMLAEQQTDYRLFDSALAREEPVLLARLAYQQFHLKPAGAAPVTAVVADSGVEPNASVETWLYKPVPRSIVPAPGPRAIESSLVRLTTGRGRVLTLVAGLLCLTMGLVIPMSND